MRSGKDIESESQLSNEQSEQLESEMRCKTRIDQTTVNPFLSHPSFFQASCTTCSRGHQSQRRRRRRHLSSPISFHRLHHCSSASVPCPDSYSYSCSSPSSSLPPTQPPPPRPACDPTRRTPHSRADRRTSPSAAQGVGRRSRAEEDRKSSAVEGEVASRTSRAGARTAEASSDLLRRRRDASEEASRSAGGGR